MSSNPTATIHNPATGESKHSFPVEAEGALGGVAEPSQDTLNIGGVMSAKARREIRKPGRILSYRLC
jgi:hypothetical protein